MDPLMRPLTRGEVGVSFLPGGLREIVSESEYELVDRTFQPGDYCKRSLDDVRSGVVVTTHLNARLVHAISSEPLKGWRNIKDLRHASSVNAGDYVVYDDWIGQVRNSRVLRVIIRSLLHFKVIEVRIYRNAVCQLVHSRSFSTNLSSQHQVPLFGCRRLAHASQSATKGLYVSLSAAVESSHREFYQDILPHPLTFHGIHNVCQGAPMPTANDTVVDLQHTVLAICWLALNQTVRLFNVFFFCSYSSSQLDRDVALKKRRPERFWHGQDLTKLTILKARSGDIRVGDKVILPGDDTAPIVSLETAVAANTKIDSRTLCVQETRTTVTVLWQDGSRETLPSTDLIPYLNVDEYDCWCVWISRRWVSAQICQ